MREKIYKGMNIIFFMFWNELIKHFMMEEIFLIIGIF